VSCKHHVSFHTYTSYNSFNIIISVKVSTTTHLVYLLSSQVSTSIFSFGFHPPAVSGILTSLLHVTKAYKSNYIQFLSFYLSVLHPKVYVFWYSHYLKMSLQFWASNLYPLCYKSMSVMQMSVSVQSIYHKVLVYILTEVACVKRNP